jgi:hypothetical protein
MALAHIYALLKKLLKATFETVTDARELRRTLGHRYPNVGE